MKKTLFASAFLLVLGLGLIAWHRAAPRLTPPSQPPLASLTAGDLAPFRDLFNASPDETRLLLMLSPT